MNPKGSRFPGPRHPPTPLSHSRTPTHPVHACGPNPPHPHITLSDTLSRPHHHYLPLLSHENTHLLIPLHPLLAESIAAYSRTLAARPPISCSTAGTDTASRGLDITRVHAASAPFSAVAIPRSLSRYGVVLGSSTLEHHSLPICPLSCSPSCNAFRLPPASWVYPARSHQSSAILASAPAPLLAPGYQTYPPTLGTAGAIGLAHRASKSLPQTLRISSAASGSVRLSTTVFLVIPSLLSNLTRIWLALEPHERISVPHMHSLLFWASLKLSGLSFIVITHRDVCETVRHRVARTGLSSLFASPVAAPLASRLFAATFAALARPRSQTQRTSARIPTHSHLIAARTLGTLDHPAVSRHRHHAGRGHLRIDARDIRRFDGLHGSPAFCFSALRACCVSTAVVAAVGLRGLVLSLLVRLRECPSSTTDPPPPQPAATLQRLTHLMETSFSTDTQQPPSPLQHTSDGNRKKGGPSKYDFSIIYQTDTFKESQTELATHYHPTLIPPEAKTGTSPQLTSKTARCEQHPSCPTVLRSRKTLERKRAATAAAMHGPPEHRACWEPQLTLARLCEPQLPGYSSGPLLINHGRSTCATHSYPDTVRLRAPPSVPHPRILAPTTSASQPHTDEATHHSALPQNPSSAHGAPNQIL
ncbi:unnamed protein product [Pleuronectes platessa]|uniref:Uncharacterized protein n=1 Tax=Pleuronectes platessa TaxID=8262 RepID=A0A9N7TPG5_PLEPL|nr:unnamed protein product [Pleuronectes platessa]